MSLGLADVQFHCLSPSVLNRFLTVGLGVRSSRQQFSRITCRAGLGSANWKPWRNALLLLTVAWTFIFPIRNRMYKSTTSPIGNSTGSVAEKPRSLISSVLPETKPIGRERIFRSTYNLNLQSRRASRRLSTFGLSVGFSALFRSCFDIGVFSCGGSKARQAEGPLRKCSAGHLRIANINISRDHLCRVR